jgi:hypothetical protein
VRSYYVSHANPAHYEPSNITFGIMQPLDANSPRLAASSRGNRRWLVRLAIWMSGSANATV